MTVQSIWSNLPAKLSSEFQKRMAQEVKTLVIDDGALIDCIRNYPAIHDEGDKDYKIPLRKTIPGKKLQT